MHTRMLGALRATSSRDACDTTTMLDPWFSIAGPDGTAHGADVDWNFPRDRAGATRPLTAWCGAEFPRATPRGPAHAERLTCRSCTSHALGGRRRQVLDDADGGACVATARAADDSVAESR